MTIVPRMSTSASAARIASTARASAAILLPRPCSVAAASAPASVTRSSSSARLRLILGSSIIGLALRVTDELSQAATADRQFVCLHQELLFARQPPVSTPVDVNARPLQDRRDPHHLAGESRVEA